MRSSVGVKFGLLICTKTNKEIQYTKTALMSKTDQIARFKDKTARCKDRIVWSKDQNCLVQIPVRLVQRSELFGANISSFGPKIRIVWCKYQFV